LAPCIIVYVALCFGAITSAKVCLGVTNCILGCAAFAWFIADAVLFGTNKYKDGNDMPLKSW
jgi:hypothetical protein